jgi:hypothetical protein
MKFTKKQMILEALGVPTGIIETSELLLPKLLKKIKSLKGDIAQLEDKEFKFRLPFKINDVEVKGINVEFLLFTNPNITKMEIFGLSQSFASQLSDDIRKSQIIIEPRVDIKIKVAHPKKTTIEELYDLIFEKKNYLLYSISHEIKHYFDGIKKPIESVVKRTKYNVIINTGMGEITPLNNFVHNMYFIDNIENLVRPTEVAHLKKLNKVKKENFIEFLTSDETYKQLKKIQNFSVEELETELINYVPKIKEIFDKNGIEYKGQSEQQVVDKMLEVFYVSLINNYTDELFKRMTSVFERMFGIPNDKKMFIRNFISRNSRFKNNPKNFYLEQEKRFKQESTKMIKKLAKLYDYPIQEQHTISNPELWYKYFAKPMKLEREIKNYKTLNEMSPNSTGVKEFINSVKEVPGLLKHLQFPNIKRFEEYLLDASEKDFHELRKEVEEFFNKAKKQKK